jgi:hypothetical protein
MLWSKSSEFKKALLLLNPLRHQTCGHALLQVAVCLQHSTLLIGMLHWLELSASGSGHTTYLYAAAVVPSFKP